MCAGTMLIEKGIIRGIATDSGHYQPDTRHVVNVLQALKMHGVDLKAITVQDFDGVLQGNGTYYLNAKGNWAAMAQRKQLNEAHMQQRRTDEENFGNAIKTMWEQGVQGGYYIDDTASKLHFLTHVLPLSKHVAGHETEGLNFLYALDAMAKATSREQKGQPNDPYVWIIEQWRTFLKGDVATNSGGMPNKRTSIPNFVTWLATKYPPGYTLPEVNTWLDEACKKTGHRFDA
jgi:hypothetical protein